MLADNLGNTVHLGERECSIQRRHQKLLEETPSPFVDDELRARMGAAAVRAARAVRLPRRGHRRVPRRQGRRVLLPRDEHAHPGRASVTELCYGVDLVRLQVRMAEGRPLPFEQSDLEPQGHAIEVRLTAEDPAAGFFPQTGIVRAVRMPQGPGDPRRFQPLPRPGDHAPLRPDDRQGHRPRSRPRGRDRAAAARAHRDAVGGRPHLRAAACWRSSTTRVS